MATKQRGKTEKATTPKAEGKKDGDVFLSEQLDRAEAAVDRNQQTALKLQHEWRAHLYRLSYVVMVVALHQMQGPSTACVKEVKAYNEIQTERGGDVIAGLEAFVLTLKDCAGEILGVFCMSMLLWCLSTKPDPSVVGADFASTPYRMSCVFIPVIVSMYFSKKRLGCIAMDENADAEILSQLPPREDRAFPLVLVFHVIVSLSLFFMQFQNRQHYKNVEMVQKLRQDLLDAKAGAGKQGNKKQR